MPITHFLVTPFPPHCRHKSKAKNDLPPSKQKPRIFSFALDKNQITKGFPGGSLEGMGPLRTLVSREAFPLLVFLPSLTRVWMICCLWVTRTLVVAAAIFIFGWFMGVMCLRPSCFLLSTGGIPGFSRVRWQPLWTRWTDRLWWRGWA